ncbi:hypothetical protein BIV08_05465 [Pseudomonas sp. AF76]|nr:hypothetical protein BIV08_05465 [Pseudomonas sp. AF76]
MCGRYSIYEPMEHYLRELAPQQLVINLALSAGKAEEIARTQCTPTDAFEWYPVSRAVGNIRNQGPQLVQPLDEET